MGILPDRLLQHIGWDIGTAALGKSLSERLDACLVEQVYSRLAVDCNRHPDHLGLIPAISDGTDIPANAGLERARHLQRIAEIHQPYHQAIAGELARRRQTGQVAVLVSLHSFTPSMGGLDRPWQIGLLHHQRPRLSLALLELLRAQPDLTVGDNEPYRMDPTDYTVPLHTDRHGLDYVEIEIRQDLLADPAGIERWAALLERLLPQALATATAEAR
jgi:predicted N-formylglutamate amidohydrolase